MKKSDKNQFIRDCPLYNEEITLQQSFLYMPCLHYIDTLIKNNKLLYEYFGDLNDEYPRYIRELVYKIYYHHLHNLAYDFDKDIDTLREIKRFNDSVISAWRTADSISGIYIPATPEEALDILDTLIPQYKISEFKNYSDEDSAVYYNHFGIRMFLRKYWHLGSSRLHNYFNQQGVKDGDAISSIILRIWYRRLNHKPLYLKKLIKERAEFEESEKRFREMQGKPK